MLLDFLRIALPAGALALAAGFAVVMTLSNAVDPKFKLMDSLLRDADPETQRRHVHAA